jgi:hypothetical protein
MGKPVTIPNTFAAQGGPIPLAQLDGDFAALAAAVNDFGTYSNYLADTGTVNAMVATVPVGTTFSLVAGTPVQIQVAVTTTSTTPTLNVSGTGAQTIVNADGTAVAVGQFVADQFVQFIYDGTNFRAISSNSPSGSFTGALTGMTGAATGAVNYRISNGVCTLTAPAAIAGTSNTPSMTMTGLPSVCQPASGSPVVACAALISNGVGNLFGVCSVNGSTITFSLSAGAQYSNTGFASANEKGLQLGWTISFPLN